ncbi:MAG: hypothetical protein H0T42_10450 [Deltaproteobacteria bacterium]|nr:hypothetical protein [Deltaproteobacteria bacterium]
MTQSPMLVRLNRETQSHQAAADQDRMQLLGAVSPDQYATFLGRIWGFEAPVEAMLVRTAAIAELVDVRARAHIRMLRADLAALGVTSPSSLPSCRTIPSFQIADALGWIFAIEHNAQMNGQLRRHLAKRIPRQLSSAGSYLSEGERSVGPRMLELGRALDLVARKGEIANRVVDAARAAFQHQNQWFRAVAMPSLARRFA